MGWDIQHYYDLLQQIWPRHYIIFSWAENDSHALNILYDRKNTVWRKINTEFRMGLSNLMLNMEEESE
jgi:hypothetical protein